VIACLDAEITTSNVSPNNMHTSIEDIGKALENRLIRGLLQASQINTVNLHLIYACFSADFNANNLAFFRERSSP